jgi:hypothetical protein
LSEKQLTGFTVLVLVNRFHAPQAARIVFDCRGTPNILSLRQGAQSESKEHLYRAEAT